MKHKDFIVAVNTFIADKKEREAIILLVDKGYKIELTANLNYPEKNKYPLDKATLSIIDDYTNVQVKLYN